jgi:CRISPR system Cascade subunit CasD
MQSWGTQSRFDVRDTGYEPSKSGVVGLLCAALGRPRHQPVDDLARLEMGARVDRQGTLQRDYHTAGKGGFYRVSGVVERKSLIESTRYYLADAIFLVGLAGDADLLDDLFHALRDPVWMLYLGRKAFVPGEPIWLPDGLRHGEGLMQALRVYPWLGHGGGPPDQLRVVRDAPDGEIVRYDTPVSFDRREFLPRRIAVEFIPVQPVDEEG